MKKSRKKLAVIASVTPDLSNKRKLKLRELACSDCGNHTVTASLLKHPFCVHCGSDDTNVIGKAEAKLLTRGDQELSAIGCPSCKTHNIVSDVAVAQLQGKISCVACGTPILFSQNTVQADDEGDEMEVDDTTAESDDNWDAWMDEPQTEESEEEDLDDESMEFDEETSADEDDNEDEEDDEELDEVESSDDEDDLVDEEETLDDTDEDDVEDASDDGDFDEDDMGDVEDDSEVVMSEDDWGDSDDSVDDEEVTIDESTDDSDEDDLNIEDLDVESAEDEDLDGGEMSDDITDVESEDVPVLDLVESDDDADEDDEVEGVEFTSSGDKVMCFFNGQHVATLKKTSETANADIFGSTRHMKAIIASVENSTSLRKGLKSNGFALATVKISSKILKSYAHSTEAATKGEAVASAVESDRLVMKQAIAIAAAGLNRQFFKDRVHVVKSRLFTDFTAAGVTDAAAVIDKAFAETEDAHNATLLTIAYDLAEKPTEIRNQISDAIDNVNPSVASSAQEKFKQTLQANLGKPVVLVAGDDEDEDEVDEESEDDSDAEATASYKGSSRVRALASAHGRSLFRVK